MVIKIEPTNLPYTMYGVILKIIWSLGLKIKHFIYEKWCFLNDNIMFSVKVKATWDDHAH